MNKEQIFQMAGVSYKFDEKKLIFFAESGERKIYFPIEKENLEMQIETCSIDFFQTFKYLQDILNEKFNRIQL